MERLFYFQVEENWRKRKLEDFLFARFPDLSKKFLRDLIKEEKCVVNGAKTSKKYILRKYDFIEVGFDETDGVSLSPENIDIEIVFEDEHLMLVNKPAGILVHPTHKEKKGTLLNALAFYFKEKGETEIRPGLLHRLDRDTSGLLLIAKNPHAHRALAKQFKKRQIEKKYFALVGGILKGEGRIDAPIGRFEEEKNWNVKTDGKNSETIYKVKRNLTGKTFVELEPVTGRTNQLRIHCAHIGHPIVGDERYGGEDFPRLCLHAAKLAFRHPIENCRVEFEIGLPAEFAK